MMKIWNVNSEWKHKRTNNNVAFRFIVVNNGEDPLETINDTTDMSGMIYLYGNIEEIQSPIAVRYD